ncbi:regulator of hypoxia-inducible factor 1-like [Wyeomyia smithii]|uniref:regulator of hypoxia-inducible factor 1-like n=1 Tax=Wyeomyia smithii TaxID=174621 RepID=UPI002467C9FE|nr:regulator of hypoxia-inducible factor 1-like [Wyeomyia smithii]
MVTFRLIVFLLLTGCLKWAFASFDASESALVPPLFRYDSYEHCRASFCSVEIHLKPNAADVVTNSRIAAGFRRNHLEWGVCVANCEAELASVSKQSQQQLYYPEFSIDYPHNYPAHYWKDRVEQLNSKYATLMNVCVNNRLQRDYNLTQRGYSSIQYCLSSDLSEQPVGRDWWTIAFLAIVFILIVSVFAASALDLFTKDAQLKDSVFVSSFAVRQNWVRLFEQPKNEIYRDFSYIDGLRFLINIYTLIIHCLLVSAILPQRNPEQFEKMSQNPLIRIFISLTPVSVQNFLVITGMLQMANFLKDHQKNQPFDTSYFRSKIINRLIRLLPVYYFYLLLTITSDSLPGVVVSPVGYSILTGERYICRRHGWKNLLFVNNLPETDTESCFLQGWYLAADQQLFLGSLVLLAAIWKFPKKINFLLSMMAVVSIIIPALIVHNLKLAAMIPIRLSDFRTMQYYQPWFNHIYQPGYTNMNGAIAGIIVGYLYHQSKTKQLNLRESRVYYLIRQSTILIVIFILGTSNHFYQHDLPRSSLRNTFYFMLYNNHGTLGGSLCFISCFLNPPGIFRRILSSQLLITLGKLSYCVYVLHVPLLRLMINYLPTPVTVTYPKIAILCTGLAVISYIFGLITYLVIEQPIRLILKYWCFDRKNIMKQD